MIKKGGIMKKQLLNINFANSSDDIINLIELDLLTKDELIEFEKNLKEIKSNIDILVLDDEYVGNSYNNISILKTKCKAMLNKY